MLPFETTHPLLILLITIVGVWFLLKLLSMRLWQGAIIAFVGWYLWKTGIFVALF